MTYLSKDDSETIGKSIEETRQYHTRYLRAINNPLRRKILRALKERSAAFEDLRSQLGLDSETLLWHLRVLEHGFCIKKNVEKGKLFYRLTQEGRVVDYME